MLQYKYDSESLAMDDDGVYDGVYVDIHHIFNITSVVLFSLYLIVCR